jgi:glyoxylase-like metal-dependent hydrolase (beta-lactamase superfamily II)
MLLSTGAVAMAVGTGGQQPPADAPKIAQIQKLKDNLFVITGGGGNTAAFITQKGVVVVDTKLAGWGPQILEKIKGVTDKPITTIINTHTHGDHTGSNEAFDANVEIIAQENTAANMAKMPALQGAEKHAMPDKTYKDKLSIGSGADRIDLYYFGAGHTNGDTFVVFPALKVVHTGDLFARKGTPLLDVNNGGSGVAYPDTLAKAAKGIKGVETVIPGHSDVTDWASFIEFGEFNKEFLAATRALKKAGKSADEAAAELKLPEKFSAYAMQGQKQNVAVIYKELEGK